MLFELVRQNLTCLIIQGALMKFLFSKEFTRGNRAVKNLFDDLTENRDLIKIFLLVPSSPQMSTRQEI